MPGTLATNERRYIGMVLSGRVVRPFTRRGNKQKIHSTLTTGCEDCTRHYLRGPGFAAAAAVPFEIRK